MVREAPPQPPPPAKEPYPTDAARGAQIEFTRPWQKHVFVGGLAGIAVLLIIFRLLAG